MEEINPGEIELTVHEWVEELIKLSAKGKSKDFCVQILWSFGHLRSTGFQPQVNKQTIHILLQRQSPSGFADGVIDVYLPKPPAGHYQKQVSKSGEICLTMFYSLGKPVVDCVEVRLATNWEFLDFLSAAARVQ